MVNVDEDYLLEFGYKYNRQFLIRYFRKSLFSIRCSAICHGPALAIERDLSLVR